MDYSSLVATLQNLLVIPAGNTDFSQILPSIIADGENRIYRELDFLTTQTSDSSLSFTASNRSVTLPSTMIILNSLAAITPATATVATGTRNQLVRYSVDYLNAIWPQASITGTPMYFAMLTDTQAIVAPTPDANYVAEFFGVVRPPPISSTNTTTWLSTNLPDLLVAACMIFSAGWQQNYSAAGADNPEQPVNWESHFQALKQGAVEEEQRRKSQGENWSPYSMTPISTPARSA